MEALKVESLCKEFPSFKLENVSFSLKTGSIMGFIGRNGAGKTTTLKSILNYIPIDSGKITINNKELSLDELTIKKSVGFISGAENFYNLKKIKTVTKITKRFFPEWNQELYNSLISKFEIDEKKKIKELSAGMKIKYQLALALSHNASLLLLDEPTSGLDPVSRDELVSIFRDYVADGRHSILFSTHIISDIEKCADYITYIKKGKILFSGTIPDFKSEYEKLLGNTENYTLEDVMLFFER